jgi:hypothetical protein
VKRFTKTVSLTGVKEIIDHLYEIMLVLIGKFGGGISVIHTKVSTSWGD